MKSSMACGIKTLSEDKMDSYTHTWCVVLFLVLAAIVLFVPTEPNQNPDIPKYKSTCWCPAQFEKSQVDYTNAVCSASFNARAEGKEYQPARIHVETDPYDEFGVPVVIRNEDRDRNNRSGNDHQNEKTNGEDKKKNEPYFGSLKLQTSLVLFLLALGLRIPHVTWVVLSSFARCANLDQTLVAANAGVTMDEEKRRRFYSHLAQGYSSNHKSSVSAILYVTLKTQMLAAIFLELALLFNFTLPGQGDEAENTLNKTMPDSYSLHTDTEVSIFHCFFDIRQMQNVHRYVVQCVSSPSYHMMESNNFDVENVNYIAMAALVVLATGNVFNTVSWLVRLCGKAARETTKLPRAAPLDVVFLVQMAQVNLSAGVATGLAESFSATTKKWNNDKENFEMD